MPAVSMQTAVAKDGKEWYNRNTGLEVGLNDDGLANYCTWNSTDGPITGADVAHAMLDIAAYPSFSNRTDEEFMAGVRDGSVAAGVSGNFGREDLC